MIFIMILYDYASCHFICIIRSSNLLSKILNKKLKKNISRQRKRERMREEGF